MSSNKYVRRKFIRSDKGSQSNRLQSHPKKFEVGHWLFQWIALPHIARKRSGVLDVQKKSVHLLSHMHPILEKTRFSMCTVLRQPSSSKHQNRIAGFQFIGLMGDNESGDRLNALAGIEGVAFAVIVIFE